MYWYIHTYGANSDILNKNNTVETSKRALIHCPFWLKRVHAAYSQIRKENPLLFLWSNKGHFAEELPLCYSSLQAAAQNSKFLKEHLLTSFCLSHLYVHTHTHTHKEKETLLSDINTIVPLQLAFRTSENVKNVLIQLARLATGKDVLSCGSGWGGDGFMLCNYKG